MATLTVPGSTRPSSKAWADGYPIAPNRRALAGLVLYLGNLMVILDTTIANVAIPHIAGNLGASLEQGTWVITSYAVAEAITVPLTGWLSARFGMVRTLLSCLMGFTLFSFLCGMSVTLPMLVACRVGQGLCGGPIMPIVQTVILRIFPPAQVPRAFAWWALTVMMGPALGPIVGGMIVDQLSWHWIFLVNVPIGLACGIVGFMLLRPAESASLRLRIDRIGMLLLVVWIGALQLMLDTGREKDWFADTSIVALAIIAGIGLCAFVIWELTEDHPVVDLRLLRNRPFALCLMGAGLSYGAYFSGIVMVPQWLQATMGYSATQAGLITAASAVGSAIAAQLSLKLMVRLDPRILVTVGSLWSGAAVLMRTLWSTDLDAYHFGLMFAVQGLGLTLSMMSLNNMAMSTVSLAETASGAGITTFVRTMSTAIAATLALSYWSNEQVAMREGLVQTMHADLAAAAFDRAAVPAAAQAPYLSSLIDQQAITVAMLHTFTIAGIAMFFAGAVIWAVPRIEVTRLTGKAK